MGHIPIHTEQVLFERAKVLYCEAEEAKRQALEEEVERLKSENRRWRAAFWGMIAAALLAWVIVLARG